MPAAQASCKVAALQYLGTYATYDGLKSIYSYMNEQATIVSQMFQFTMRRFETAAPHKYICSYRAVRLAILGRTRIRYYVINSIRPVEKNEHELKFDIRASDLFVSYR